LIDELLWSNVKVSATELSVESDRMTEIACRQEGHGDVASIFNIGLAFLEL